MTCIGTADLAARESARPSPGNPGVHLLGCISTCGGNIFFTRSQPRRRRESAYLYSFDGKRVSSFGYCGIVLRFFFWVLVVAIGVDRADDATFKKFRYAKDRREAISGKIALLCWKSVENWDPCPESSLAPDNIMCSCCTM